MEDKSGCRLGWICDHQIILQWIIHFRLIWWRTLQTSTLHTGRVGENLGVLGEWFIWKPHPIIDFNICRTLNLANYLTKRFFSAYWLTSVFWAVYWLSSIFVAVYWLQLYPLHPPSLCNCLQFSQQLLMFISGYVNKHEKFFLRVSIVLCRVFLKCSKSSWSVKEGSASRVCCIDTKIDMKLLHWFIFLAYLLFFLLSFGSFLHKK